MQTETCELVDYAGLIIPIRFLINVFHVTFRWVAESVEAVSNSNSMQTIPSHRINYSANEVFTLFLRDFIQASGVIKNPAAPTKNKNFNRDKN